MSVNCHHLMGNIGKDLELKYTASKKAVVNFSIATSDGFGEHKKTNWHNIIAWDKQAEAIAKYFKKGDPIYIQGTVNHTDYVDKNNLTRYKTEVTVREFSFVGGKKDGTKATEDSQAPILGKVDAALDDIPFVRFDY